MDLKHELFDTQKNADKGGWKATSMSLAIHGLLVAGVIYAGTHEPTHKVDAEKPIAAFISQGAAPPPPPPPPPPPEAGGGAPKATPKVEPKPIETPKPVRLTPPVETPKELPKVNIPTPTSMKSLPVIETPVEPASGGGNQSAGDAKAGVPGGVAGGVAGGVVGGELGGIVGGVIGGVKGGELGGKLGGQLGGKGTGTEGDGTGGPEAPVAPPKPPPPPPPPPEPTGPLRVGGDVKAPVATSRQKPSYTEAARRARVAGIVVLEAVIDRNGNVKDVRVVKDLPMGLSDQAVKAVRQWKFRPGSLNGKPVDTIFNLTVSFELD